MPYNHLTPSAAPGARPFAAESQAGQYNLLVMNVEAGITATVKAFGASRDDAIRRYQLANPACMVIPVVVHAE